MSAAGPTWRRPSLAPLPTPSPLSAPVPRALRARAVLPFWAGPCLPPLPPPPPPHSSRALLRRAFLPPLPPIPAPDHHVPPADPRAGLRALPEPSGTPCGRAGPGPAPPPRGTQPVGAVPGPGLSAAAHPGSSTRGFPFSARALPHTRPLGDFSYHQERPWVPRAGGPGGGRKGMGRSRSPSALLARWVCWKGELCSVEVMPCSGLWGGRGAQEHVCVSNRLFL